MRRQERHDRIRALFMEMQPATHEEVGKRARTEGLYDFEFLQRGEDLAVIADVRAALRGSKTVEGVRAFIPIERSYREIGADGEPIEVAPRWKQTDLCSYHEIMAGYIDPGLKGMDDDYGELEAMAAYMRRRFGQGPELPPWRTPSR